MSLNWEWNDKMGEAVMENQDRKCVIHLFKGNAYCIWVWRDLEEKTYALADFWADKDHLKNMLGLNAKQYGEDNIVERHLKDMEIKTLRLNTAYKHVPEIVQLLAKAKTNVTIELYNE